MNSLFDIVDERPVYRCDTGPACKACDSRDLHVSREVFSNGTQHLRGVCVKCQRFVQWVPQTDAVMALLEKKGGAA